MTFNSIISLAPEQLDIAASEKVDVAVAFRQISRIDPKEQSYYDKHGSQQQQERKRTCSQNNLTYEIGTFEVLSIEKENQ